MPSAVQPGRFLDGQRVPKGALREEFEKCRSESSTHEENIAALQTGKQNASVTLHSGTARTLESRIAEAIHVTDKGADPTFTSDSYSGIQSSLDAAATAVANGRSYGRSVYAPPGAYKYAGTLTIPSGVTFFSDSEALGSVLSSVPTAELYNTSTTDGYAVEFASGGKNMVLRGLKIADSVGTTSLRKGVLFRGIASGIDSCFVGMFGCEAVVCNGLQGFSYIRNSRLYGHINRTWVAALAGFNGQLHVVDAWVDGFLSDNYIGSGATYSALGNANLYSCAFYGYNVAAGRISGNTFQNGDVGCYLTGGSTGNLAFMGNRFEYNAGHGLWVNQATRCQFMGAGFVNNGLAADNTYYDIYQDLNTLGCTYDGLVHIGTPAGAPGNTTNKVKHYFYNNQNNTTHEDDIGFIGSRVWPSRTVGTAAYAAASGAKIQIDGQLKDYGTATPTAGTWPLGWERVNTAPAAAGAHCWRNTVAGTAGTISSVTADTTSGSDTITMSGANNIYYAKNMYISIVGVTGTKRIVSKTGTTVVLDSNCNATVTGGAVALVAPVWKAVSVAA